MESEKAAIEACFSEHRAVELPPIPREALCRQQRKLLGRLTTTGCAALLILIELVLSAHIAWAQDTAAIVGTLTDPTGALIPDATVIVLNQGTQFRRTVQSNASGQYVASSIPTGTYTVTALKAGFKKLSRSGIQLTAVSTLTVNLQLSVGAETQTISVTGAAPLLQEQSATVSSLVDSKQIVELPLVSRDFTDLVLLTPGAHTGSGGGNLSEGSSGYSMRGGDNYSVNGSLAAANSYLVDGIFDRNLWLNTLVVVPIVDSIQEYRVMSSNYSAEYGDSAGAVTEVETKSGTNEWHGDLWEFVRNTDLNANDYFNNLNGIPRPAFHRNQFGGTFGGPILHNKTFFFIDYEGTRASQPNTSITTIPTPAEVQMIKTGDFSNFGTTIYNPYSTTTVNGKTVRNPFPQNRIPADMLDLAIGRLVSLLPPPNISGAVNNYIFNAPQTQETNQFDVRIDQNLGASDHVFVRYDYDKSDFVTPGAVPSPVHSPVPIGPYLSSGSNATTEPLFNQGATVGYTKVISSKTVSESHLGLVRWHAEITPMGEPFNTSAALGIPGLNFNKQSGGLASFSLSGFDEIGDSGTYPEDSAITTIQADTALTLVRGSHTINFGIIALRHWINGFSGFPTRGSFSFNGQFTSQIGKSSSKTALADLALGAMSSGSRGFLDGTFGMREWQLAPFVQDTWRATDRLTLTGGLRWEVHAPPYEVHNHWANLDLDTGLLLLAGVNGNGRRLRDFDLSTVGPRLGIAYVLTSDRKTVLHTGFGLSYVYTYAAGSQLYKNLPYFSTQTISTTSTSPPVQTVSQGLPIPVPPIGETEAQLSTGSPYAWQKNMKEAQMATWSLGIQRQLESNLMLDVGYVGTRGNRLPIHNINPNQAQPGPGPVGPRRPYYAINPKLVNINYTPDSGGSKYESLQAHLEKRFSRGFSFGVSYTYSEYLSDSGDPNSGGNNNYQNDLCVSCNWGPMTDDYKHVLSVNHVYELPIGPQHRYASHGLLSYLLGGWQVNGIWSAHSGGRFTATYSTNVSNQSGGGTQRPNRIGSGKLPSSQRNINHWFNIVDFVAPPQYTYGNSGTGILTGPNYFNVDLGLYRSFRLTERFHLTYRSEWFNAFNHPTFSDPDASIGDPQAGIISSTSNSPRIIQMALKLVF